MQSLEITNKVAREESPELVGKSHLFAGNYD